MLGVGGRPLGTAFRLVGGCHVLAAVGGLALHLLAAVHAFMLAGLMLTGLVLPVLSVSVWPLRRSGGSGGSRSGERRDVPLAEVVDAVRAAAAS